jgi:PAS domain S-box-containing protein
MSGRVEDDELHVQVQNRLIEELNERNQELLASERRYRSLVDSLPHILVVVRADGRVELANQTWTELLGHPLDEVIGRPFEDFVSPEHRERLREACEGNGERELEISCSGQGYRWMRFRTQRRAEAGWQGLLVDISETRSLEEQLRQANKMEAVGRLAGGVAHDFNNLLTVIVGSADLILDDGAGDPEFVRGEAQRIQATAQEGAAWTRQLLTFSRRQVMEQQVVDLVEVVEQSKVLLERLVGQQLRVEFGTSSEGLWVDVDPGQVGQVLMNLTINARDAMEEGGRLRIGLTARRLEEPEGVRLGAGAGEYAVLLVEDDGHGMDQATVDHIFEPFFTTKPTGRGTGFGLATVYGIVKQSGGAISVDSSPGRGTRFEVFLPRVRPPAARERAAERRTSTPACGRVLMVEDNEFILKTMSQALRTAGFTVLAAISGEEAIEIMAREAAGIDLVITDLGMPGIRGEELIRHILALPQAPVVIAVSGFVSDETRAQLPSQVSFLQKPYGAQELIGLAQGALAEGGA